MTSKSSASSVMNFISCKCLNVKFSSEGLNDLTTTVLSSVPAEVAAYFDKERMQYRVKEKRMFGDGSQVALQALLIVKPIKDWKIYICYNCKTPTHATMTAKDLILVNSGELINDKCQIDLQKDSNYFPLYGIVLKETPQRQQKMTSLKPSVVETMRKVKEEAADFLDAEERAMKMRIAQYQASQIESYNDLKQNTIQKRKDLEHMIYAAYHEGNEDNDSAFERSVEEISNFTNSPQNSGKGGIRSDSLVDEMFDLDPFNSDTENAPLDDDFDDDDDDNEVPNYSTRRRGTDQSDVLAKSVPVQVPSLMGRPTSMRTASDTSDDETPDHLNMPASMRALAQSIGGDGTEMFGDLPRQRFQRYKN